MAHTLHLRETVSTFGDNVNFNIIYFSFGEDYLEKPIVQWFETLGEKKPQIDLIFFFQVVTLLKMRCYVLSPCKPLYWIIIS